MSEYLGVLPPFSNPESIIMLNQKCFPSLLSRFMAQLETWMTNLTYEPEDEQNIVINLTTGLPFYF